MTIQIPLTPTLDTSQYDNGDILFQPTEIVGAVRSSGARALLQSVFAIGEDDQGQGFDLLFFQSAVTFGTINAAPSISDSAARDFQGRVQIQSSDFYDLGGVRVADVSQLGRLIQAASTTRSIWVAGISRGTGTYTAAGLKFRFGFVW